METARKLPSREGTGLLAEAPSQGSPGRSPRGSVHVRGRRTRLDPGSMSSDERLSEIAQILAEGYVRLCLIRGRRTEDGQEPSDLPVEGMPPDSRRKDLQCPPSMDSCGRG